MYDLLRAAARGAIGIDHRFLHAVLDRRREALAELVKFAAEDRSGDAIDLEEDLIALFRHFEADEALPFYISVLRENPHDVPDLLLDALVDRGAAAVEPLLELYDQLEEDESSEVAFALAALRVRDERVRRVLEERLEYDAVDGAINLGLYGDPETKPVLRRLLEATPEKESHTRHAIEAGIRDIDDAGDQPAAAPFQIWELYPERALPDFEALSEEEWVEALAHEDAEFRAGAAHCFFNRETATEVRAKLFDMARHDVDATVRARCWEALMDETERDAELSGAMLAVARDAEAPDVERGGAIVGLAQEGERAEVRETIEALYERPGTRAKALEAMWRTLDRSFARYFPAHLDDADRDVQRAAVWGAGYLNLQSEVGRIENLFDDDDLRSDALFAYALAAPGEVSPARMRALLRRIDTLAGGLSGGEEDLVKLALDERLTLRGMKPVFYAEPEDEKETPATPPAKPGRNDPCPCGSGKKYKKCCGA